MLPRIHFPQAGLLFLLSVWLLSTGCQHVSPTPPGAVWGHLHHPRYGAAAVTDGRYIYVLGGSDATYRNVPAERIDPQTGTVEILPWQLIQRRYHSAVIHDGNIWIFGGESTNNAIPGVERVDLETGRVTGFGAAVEPRVGSSAVGWQRRIVVAGGLGPNEQQDGRGRRVEFFDPTTARASRGPDLPGSLQTEMVLLQGNPHVVGGWEPQGGSTATHYRLTAPGGAWEQLPDLPWPMSAHALAATGRNLYSFGDYMELARVARYDARRGTWVRLETAYTARRHAAAVAVGDRIFVIGGNTATRRSALDLIEVFDQGTLAHAPGAP